MATLQVLLALASLMVPTSVGAATFADMPFSELVDRSDRVVLGIVAGTSARFADGEDSRILTDVTVRVVRDLLPGIPEGRSDSASRTIVFATPGGVVGDRGQRVPGLPRYQAGDEVVLFLGPARGPLTAPDASVELVERRAVVGLALGVFFVRRGPQGQPAILHRPIDAPLSNDGLPFGDGRTVLLDQVTQAIRSHRLAHPTPEAP